MQGVLRLFAMSWLFAWLLVRSWRAELEIQIHSSTAAGAGVSHHCSTADAQHYRCFPTTVGTSWNQHIQRMVVLVHTS